MSLEQDVGDREFDPYALVNPYEKWQGRGGSGRQGNMGAGDAFTEDYVSWLRRSQRRRRLLMVAFGLVALLLAVAVIGFIAYDNLREPDLSSYAHVGITISGLEEEDFVVTPAELAAMPIEAVSVNGSGRGPNGESRAGTVNAFGPLIETFLQSRGYTTADFRRIVFRCKDGYSVSLRQDDLEGDVILTVASGREPLPAYQQPLRIVLPDGATNQWTFGILRIEFSLAEDAAAAAGPDADAAPVRSAESGTETPGEEQ
jgi:hypothetical protein